MKYNEEQAEVEAAVARNSMTKPKVTKKIITPKKTVITRVDRHFRFFLTEFKSVISFSRAIFNKVIYKS